MQLAAPTTRPSLERLEDRTLMSTCHVTRLTDQGIGKGFRGDLRYCINKVNTEPDPDVIDFTVQGTVKLQTALPDLSTDITIQGPGDDLLTVSAELKAFRVFHVLPGAAVNMSGLTIANGSPATSPGGGGVLNSGNLTLTDCTVTGNRVIDDIFDVYGGGIYNEGTMLVWNCTVSDNENFTHWMLSDSRGGGIHNAKTGIMTIRSSTIADNLAANDDDGYASGGGIYNAGQLDVINSTISDNHTEANSSSFSSAGAVYNATGATLAVNHSTIAFNDVDSHVGSGSGGWIGGNGTLNLRNTIVAKNTGDSTIGGISGDHNWIGGDPKLGPLADNGGPTLTHALLPSSLAIDAGDNAGAPMWDQRGPGFPRIVNGTVDIGAFEVQATGAPTVSRPSLWLAGSILITADFESLD